MIKVELNQQNKKIKQTKACLWVWTHDKVKLSNVVME